MNIHLRSRSLRGLCLAAFASVLLITPAVLSQQAAPKKPAAAKAEANGNQCAKRASRRLPRYYAQVVTPVQREKIYELQAAYQEQIDALEAQLKAVMEKRDAEIEALLTPQQRETLAKIVAEAAERSAAKKRSAQPEAAAPPATAKKPAAGN